MGLPNEIHPFLITGNDANQYKVANSLRFRANNSAYLSRTPGSASNQTTFTWSGWVKLGTLSTYYLFTGGTSSTNRFQIDFYLNALEVSMNNGTWIINLLSTQVFRDPAAWYHVVVSVDTTQATSTNRVKLYVNGSQITSFQTSTYPTQNLSTPVNSTVEHTIGQSKGGGGGYFDGYMAEVNFIDGQALTPSSFGYTDNLTNQWVPKQYTGTYGTNGFYLPFKDNSSTTTLGYDVTNGTGALTTPYAASITTNNSGWDTLGVRMLLTTGAIQQQGKSFRITLKSGSNGLNIQGVKFGVKASSGNAWDFTGDQVSVTFGGATTYSLGSNSTLTSDWMVYPSIINPSSDYILALAIGTTNGTTLSGSATTGSIRNYTKAGDYNSGALTTAPTGYSDAGTAAYFLTALEVQGNNWTPSGISVTSGVTYDVMRDSPTAYDDGGNNRGNYCTLNRLNITGSNAGNAVISNGNLNLSYPAASGGNAASVTGTIGVSIGKWYFEVFITAFNPAPYNGYMVIGVTRLGSTRLGYFGSNDGTVAGYKNNQNTSTNSAYGANYTVGDMIGVALDMDNGTLTFYKNNVSQGVAFSGINSSYPGEYFPIISNDGGSSAPTTYDANFGQRPFSYTPPAGFKALNSFNLPNPSLPLV